jgi:hypothetical protein
MTEKIVTDIKITFVNTGREMQWETDAIHSFGRVAPSASGL